MTQAILFAAAAFAQQPELTLRVAPVTAVPGGWAQIQVYAASPVLISEGSLSVDLDPAIFGLIAGVSTFSANGDAVAFASSSGVHVETTIVSRTGGLGQLPELPLFVIRAQVLPGASGSGSIQLSLPARKPSSLETDPLPYPASAWINPMRQAYNVKFTPGVVTVAAGRPFVENVSPGGGLQPPGSVLKIQGGGFSSATSLSADGLQFSSVTVVSPTLIEATLANSREISGVPLRLTSNGGTLTFFPGLPSEFRLETDTGASAAKHVVAPLIEGRNFAFGNGPAFTEAAVAINAGPAPANVIVIRDEAGGAGVKVERLSIPPGGLQTIQNRNIFFRVTLESDQPLRVVRHWSYRFSYDLVTPIPQVDLQPVQLSLWPNTVSVDYQYGTPNPDPVYVSVNPDYGARDFTFEVENAPWLTVTKDPEFSRLKLFFTASAVAVNSYTGTITLRPIPRDGFEAHPIQTATITVTLRSSVNSTLVAETSDTPAAPGEAILRPTSILVRTNGSPSPFTASVTTSRGGNWLSLDKYSGSTPASIAPKADLTGLAPGEYQGRITIVGSNNTVIVDVQLLVLPLPPQLEVFPKTLTYTREAGHGGASFEVKELTTSTSAFTVTAQTENGGDWLHARKRGPLNEGILVELASESLPPGSYRGTITASTTAQVVHVPVSLDIVPAADSPPQGLPSALEITVPVNEVSEIKTLRADTPAQFTYNLLPATVSIASVDALGARFLVSSQQVGTIYGRITATNSAGSVVIPVTIHVTASPKQPPVIASITNGASQRVGPISPGEIISIRGVGVGPNPTGLRLNEQGRIQARGPESSRVLINGIEAPILYGSVSQWNVVVPYEVQGSPSASVQVFAAGAQSAPWTVPIAPAAPGIFTADSTGMAQAAVLNQDNSANSKANPASAGTILQIFATGAGLLNPPGVTGTVTEAPGSTQLSVLARLGGTNADVVYAGPAPGLASGVVQVNVVIPSLTAAAPELPLVLIVNGVETPTGVTVSVR